MLNRLVGRSAGVANNMTQSNVITVDDVTYTYPKAERSAVDRVSFSVARGEVFGLLGPSGAGKSTIQKILTRQFRRITDGSVSVLGKNLSDWGHNYYEQIGVGFELPNHYLRLTGEENLKFFASLYTSKTRDPLELLAMVGLEKAAKKRVSDYSKGMAMRLNFARALIHDPELLFFDEPTSGLDPVNAQNVKNIIRNLQQSGKTVVLTTHNMHDVEELCERCGFMVRGEMTILDRVEALKAKYGTRTVEVTYDSAGALASDVFPLDDLGQNPEFLDRLNNFRVRTIHSQEATLDQVFGEVTGVDLGGEDE